MALQGSSQNINRIVVEYATATAVYSDSAGMSLKVRLCSALLLLCWLH